MLAGPTYSGSMHVFRLSGKIAALNAPNVSPVHGTFTKTVPWNWDAGQMLGWVPTTSNHLVFSCHGFHTGKKADFPAVHMSIGTVLHPQNVGAFDVLMSALELRVIWVTACSLAMEDPGDAWLAQMARRSGCYVVANSFDTPDRSPPWNCVEDTHYLNAVPKYFKPDGGTLGRESFLALGSELRFKKG